MRVSIALRVLAVALLFGWMAPLLAQQDHQHQHDPAALAKAGAAVQAPAPVKEDPRPCGLR